MSVTVTVWISNVELPHKSVAKNRRSKMYSSGQFVGGKELKIEMLMFSWSVQSSVAVAGG